MHKHRSEKPDGRELLLYGRRPVRITGPLPALRRDEVSPPPHLRWHPLRGEWVAYATGRQNRTFLPQPEYNPLAPTIDAEHPTELPQGDYDVAVFENLFPALRPDAGGAPEDIVETRPGLGACEVVVYTQDPESSLGALAADHIELILEVWADRYRELGAKEGIEYVMPFENRGVEVGVTIQHPHGQIFAYPFVPPVAARELEQQHGYLQSHGRGLLASLIDAEVADGRRIVHASDDVVAFVPVCARYAYELWIAPRRAFASLAELDDRSRAAFARALKVVLMKLDALWQRPFPYVMVIHQAPTDARPHPEAHVHLELYPAYRMRTRLRYLAGSELGAGVFTADTVPEEKAAELRAVAIDFE